MVNIKNSSVPLRAGVNISIIAVICLMLMTTIASAANTLEASVDRNQIHAQDTIKLSITGEVEMEFSLGGLMNFGRNQITEPELESLEKDFEILDQNQNYSMRSINGETKAQVSWNYTLAPKRTGSLLIPVIEYQGASSKAIPITVLEGKAPRDVNTPPMVFIEAEVDKTSAYVQEQVVYTLRLYSADHLASGDLSAPTPNDAIVEAIGDTKKYFRMAYNQRYEVRERRYLIFPQRSGELTIEAQSFNGMLIDTRTRRRVRVSETSEPINVNVKAPPSEFSGDLWLPATSFELTERWDNEPYDLKVSDSATRTIEIKSLGLLGSALPPIEMKQITGLKVYPDQPVLESYEHPSGAQSLRSETAALVAVSPSEVELPEIRIPWWDTVNDVERTAVIPSRKFAIAPAPNSAPPADTSAATPSLDNEITDASTLQAYPPETDVTTQPPASNNHPWYVIIALLIIGWISTTWFLLKRQQTLTKDNLEKRVHSAPPREELIKAIKSASPEIPKLLITWAQQQFSGDKKIVSIDDLKSIDAYLYQTAIDIERHFYGDQARGEPLELDKTNIISTIKRLETSNTEKEKVTDLQPMYP